MRWSQDVYDLQSILNKLDNAKLLINGYRGAKTEKAIKAALGDAENKEPHSEYFEFSEFTCPDGTELPKEYWGNLQKNMDMLEALRECLGNNPITIVSGYRTPAYNASIGGAKNSQHMYGAAADIKVSGVSPLDVYNKADKLYTDGGVGKYNTFTHVDVRGHKSRW